MFLDSVLKHGGLGKGFQIMTEQGFDYKAIRYSALMTVTLLVHQRFSVLATPRDL